MARHTIKEILAHFAHHVQHTHEAAVQATYNLGHAAGQAEVKDEILAGWRDAQPSPSPAKKEPTAEQLAAANPQRAADEQGRASPAQPKPSASA